MLLRYQYYHESILITSYNAVGRKVSGCLQQGLFRCLVGLGAGQKDEQNKERYTGSTPGDLGGYWNHGVQSAAILYRYSLKVSGGFHNQDYLGRHKRYRRRVALEMLFSLV